MPGYKGIRSAAHNVADSFCGVMNPGPECTVVCHILAAATEAGEPEFRASLTEDVIEPAFHRTAAVCGSVTDYGCMLVRLVESHGGVARFVRGASLRLRFDLDDERELVQGVFRVWVPYECIVEVLDDRGRSHVGRVGGLWPRCGLVGRSGPRA